MRFDLGSLFFVKQKTAYEVRISDWSSDVCSSDLLRGLDVRAGEKVLWVGENSWEVVAVNHAARKVGAVCVPMNYRPAPDEAAYVIDNCDRSEALRVGNECVSTCRSRWSPSPL